MLDNFKCLCIHGFLSKKNYLIFVLNYRICVQNNCYKYQHTIQMLTRCHLETIWPQVIFEFKTEENQFTIKGFVDISLIEKKKSPE